MLVLISPEEDRRDEVAVAVALLGMGVDVYHLRKPRMTPQQRLASLLRFPVEYHGRIRIHGEVAWPEGMEAVPLPPVTRHLRSTELDLAVDGARSASLHSLDEWGRIPPSLDYAFISPVFDSLSKEGYVASSGLRDPSVVSWNASRRASSACRLVALGGIGASVMDEVERLGYDGVAVLGAVWGAADPLASGLDIIEAYGRVFQKQ